MNDSEIEQNIVDFIKNSTGKFFSKGLNGMVFKFDCHPDYESKLYSIRSLNSNPLRSIIVKAVFVSTNTEIGIDSSHLSHLLSPSLSDEMNNNNDDIEYNEDEYNDGNYNSSYDSMVVSNFKHELETGIAVKKKSLEHFNPLCPYYLHNKIYKNDDKKDEFYSAIISAINYDFLYDRKGKTMDFFNCSVVTFNENTNKYKFRTISKQNAENFNKIWIGISVMEFVKNSISFADLLDTTENKDNIYAYCYYKLILLTHYGYLHGDLHQNNILMIQNENNDENDDKLDAVIIDFGKAYHFDEEIEYLKNLKTTNQSLLDKKQQTDEEDDEEKNIRFHIKYINLIDKHLSQVKQLKSIMNGLLKYLEKETDKNFNLLQNVLINVENQGPYTDYFYEFNIKNQYWIRRKFNINMYHLVCEIHAKMKERNALFSRKFQKLQLLRTQKTPNKFGGTTKTTELNAFESAVKLMSYGDKSTQKVIEELKGKEEKKTPEDIQKIQGGGIRPGRPITRKTTVKAKKQKKTNKICITIVIQPNTRKNKV